MPDSNKVHFANFFNVFTDPQNDMLVRELAFNSDLRLVYKDEDSVLHLLPSIDDYTNIYDPSTIEITQTGKDATVGVGTEGDFSDNVTMAIPHEFNIISTGIHERQVLIHYNSSDAIKDILALPEFMCKLGNNADIFNVNTGVLNEKINKIRVTSQPEREELTNNVIFKLAELDTTTVDTSFGYALTTEANKDNASFRDRIYVGADNFVYLIKDKIVESLDLPYYVFNTRTTPINVRIETKYFLFEENDKFSLKTYRSFSDNAVAENHQFIEDAEDLTITAIIQSSKITPIRNSSENLTISDDDKKVEGLDSESYYEIVVTTDEVKAHPTVKYEILDISDGFFNYLHTIMKNISDNSSGVGGASIGSGLTKKYLFEYTFVAAADDITEFLIPEEYYTPINGDREMLSYKGVNLDKGIDYDMESGTRLVELNFALAENESIHAFIFKYAESGDEMAMVSSLQNSINSVRTDIGADISSLTTTDKTNLINAINELVTRVSQLE